MKRTLVVILLLTVGCATINIPIQGEYPFRAEFSLKGMVDGHSVCFSGAILIVSATDGIVEVYGPSGLAVYAINIHDGSINILDTWGRILDKYTIPCKDALGIMAGFPPGGSYLSKKRHGNTIKIRYIWGSLILDKDMLPKSLHLKLDRRPIDVVFNPTGKMIKLMILSGYDRLDIELFGREGGRWR
ncbi:MAG: hypothetical protein J7L53_09085 [Deltaproteobacteria bacterium]|nr:hypothetical protein [Deltaproteobacteria bacterium]